MNAFKRITYLFLLVSLVVGTFGFYVQPVQAAKKSCTLYYTVRIGDTIAKIARRNGLTQRQFKKMNEISNESDLDAGDRVCVADSSTTTTTTGSTTKWSGGKVTVSQVVEDDNVTVKGSGLPGNTRVDIVMYRTGSSAANSAKAGTATTNANGVFQVTVDIPKKMVDVEKVTVRVKSGSLIYAEGTFWNEDSGSSSSSGTSGNLKIYITSVDEGNSVRVRGEGFPKQTRFQVYMSDKKNSDWIKVGAISTGSKTTFTETFDIPGEIDDASQIRIKFTSSDGDDSVSATFTNDDDFTGGDSDDGDVTVSVVEVVGDVEVDVRFTGLPANEKFTVYIGTASSKGTDGSKVGTVKSDKGGTVTKAFKIPSEFKGVSKLAIRIESAKHTAFATFTND